VRLIFFQRFRQADRLGKAARLLGEGHPEEALRRIDGEQATLHPDLRVLFHAVRGRALEALGRIWDAHSEYLAAAKAQPSNVRAQLDLALSEAAIGKMEQSATRLRRIAADPEAEGALREVALRAICLEPVTQEQAHQNQ
jgi:tetratricopeptide (TPR) repeat protein